MNPALQPIPVLSAALASSLGSNIAETVANMRAGMTGIRATETYSVSRERKFRAGEMDFGAASPRSTMLEVLHCALRDSALTPAQILRAGLFVGTTAGAIFEEEAPLIEQFKRQGDVEAFLSSRGVGCLAHEIAKECGIDGPVFTYSTACTSSAVALLAALHAIRTRRIDHAVVVGVDFLTNLTLYGFRSLLLYDSECLRPFDKHRNGLQLGEGCAALILGPHAERKPSLPYRILGGANFNDNTHVTATAEDGHCVANVLQQALQRSGVSRHRIRAIKAHGTGTRDNDLAEGRGIRRAFGTEVPFASIKAYFGHTLGAAGVLETVAYMGCLSSGFIPPNLGFEALDPDIGIEPEQQILQSGDGVYLMNFFGFGGSCTSFVLEMID